MDNLHDITSINCQLDLTRLQMTQLKNLTLTFDCPCATNITLNPAKLTFQAVNGSNIVEFKIHHLIMLDIAVNGVLVAKSMVTPSCFVGEAFQLVCKEKLINIVVSALMNDDTQLSDIGIVMGDATVTKQKSVKLKAHYESLNFRITVRKVSQITVYFIDKDGQDESTCDMCYGLTFFHDTVGYCTLYRDTTRRGAWKSEERIKLGFFTYKIGEPYDVLINTQNRDCIAMINSRFSGDDETRQEVKMFNFELPEKTYSTSIGLAKQTYMNGLFELEDLMAEALKTQQGFESSENEEKRICTNCGQDIDDHNPTICQDLSYKTQQETPDQQEAPKEQEELVLNDFNVASYNPTNCNQQDRGLSEEEGV